MRREVAESVAQWSVRIRAHRPRLDPKLSCVAGLPLACWNLEFLSKEPFRNCPSHFGSVDCSISGPVWGGSGTVMGSESGPLFSYTPRLPSPPPHLKQISSICSNLISTVIMKSKFAREGEQGWMLRLPAMDLGPWNR